MFAFLLVTSLHTRIGAQIVTKTDSDTTDQDDIVDPDYKPLTKSGNTVNGKWYGIGNVVATNRSNSYLCELLLKEDKKGKVTGYFNYFFRDGYFSNKLYGTYDRVAQTFKFKPVILLFHQTVKADIGVDVPMYGDFILNLNTKDTTLTGFLNPISNYKYLVPPLNIKLSIVGKKEPTLKERVRRRKLELEEDADVATVLNESKKDSSNPIAAKPWEDTRKKYKNDVLKFSDSTNRNYKNDTLKFATSRKNNKQRDNIKNIEKGKSHTTNDAVKYNLSNQTATGRDQINFKSNSKKTYSADTIHPHETVVNKGRDVLKFSTTEPNVSRDTLRFNKQISVVNKAVEEEYKRRTTNLINTLVVKDDSVTVSLYDNGEFDHDMVSVLFNGKLLGSNIELKTNAPTKFVVYLDKNPGAKNELTLFAENLGTIPPNSALMIVEDTHGNRYEVTLKSDLSHNASVLLTPEL